MPPAWFDAKTFDLLTIAGALFPDAQALNLLAAVGGGCHPTYTPEESLTFRLWVPC